MNGLAEKLDQKLIEDILMNIYYESQKNDSLGAKEIIMEIVSTLQGVAITNK